MALDALNDLDNIQTKAQGAEEEKKAKEHFYALPEGTVLISMPTHFQVFGWGHHLPGVEVVNHTDAKRSRNDTEDTIDVDQKHLTAATRPLPMIDQYLTLPVGHFYVNRTRNTALPPGLRDGLSKKYESMSHYFRKLPPGVSIIHVYPTNRLPRCCKM